MLLLLVVVVQEEGGNWEDVWVLNRFCRDKERIQPRLVFVIIYCCLIVRSTGRGLIVLPGKGSIDRLSICMEKESFKTSQTCPGIPG